MAARLGASVRIVMSICSLSRTYPHGQLPPIRSPDELSLPPSVDEWLPEKHLARFIVEVIENLDLTTMSKSYRGTSGSASYHPAPLLGLLVYGYATGVFSSRKLERATYDPVAFPLHRGERSS